MKCPSPIVFVCHGKQLRTPPPVLRTFSVSTLWRMAGAVSCCQPFATAVLWLAVAAGVAPCGAQVPPSKPVANKTQPTDPWSAFPPQQQGRLREADRLKSEVYRLWKAGRYRDALPLAKQVLKIHRGILGAENAFTAWSLINVAAQYEGLSEYAMAEPFYEKALESQKRSLGEQHPDYAQTLDNLAFLYSEMGEYPRRETLQAVAGDCRENSRPAA